MWRYWYGKPVLTITLSMLFTLEFGLFSYIIYYIFFKISLFIFQLLIFSIFSPPFWFERFIHCSQLRMFLCIVLGRQFRWHSLVCTWQQECNLQVLWNRLCLDHWNRNTLERFWRKQKIFHNQSKTSLSWNQEQNRWNRSLKKFSTSPRGLPRAIRATLEACLDTEKAFGTMDAYQIQENFMKNGVVHQKLMKEALIPILSTCINTSIFRCFQWYHSTGSFGTTNSQKSNCEHPNNEDPNSSLGWLFSISQLKMLQTTVSMFFSPRMIFGTSHKQHHHPRFRFGFKWFQLFLWVVIFISFTKKTDSHVLFHRLVSFHLTYFLMVPWLRHFFNEFNLLFRVNQIQPSVLFLFFFPSLLSPLSFSFCSIFSFFSHTHTFRNSFTTFGEDTWKINWKCTLDSEQTKKFYSSSKGRWEQGLKTNKYSSPHPPLFSSLRLSHKQTFHTTRKWEVML